MPSVLSDLLTALDTPRLRSTSRLYLEFALRVLTQDGAAGTLTIHLPRKATEPIEVEFAARQN